MPTLPLGKPVSTHASAREATGPGLLLCPTPAVSTHASAREATGRELASLIDERVSTHASAREATSLRTSTSGLVSCFYPRLREGGD